MCVYLYLFIIDPGTVVCVKFVRGKLYVCTPLCVSYIVHVMGMGSGEACVYLYLFIHVPGVMYVKFVRGKLRVLLSVYVM